jgi:diaminohydroxyphosphoribosylaminopyrimidine deaminase/5-amino-6-(5-phosphoribosylamino)uracil reductase
VLADDPLLTARSVARSRPLVRVILSNTLKMPLTSQLITSAREHPTIVYCSESSDKQQAEQLRTLGVEVIALPNHDSHFSFADVLADLHRRAVTHLLVEPGPTLARYMFARSQADRVWVFRSPRRIDEPTAPAGPEVEYPTTGSADLAGDVLTEYLNPQSPAFFASVPSADFVLAREPRV